MKKKPAMVFMLLALIFAAPGIFAYFFYTHPHYLETAGVNRGQLLYPPLHLSLVDKKTSAELLPHHGLAAKAVALTHRPSWSFMLWYPQACDGTCLAKLEQLARVRLAMGRHLYDVQLSLLLAEDTPEFPQSSLQLLQSHDIKILHVTNDVIQKHDLLQKRLAIFIANHDNDVVLAYPPTAKSKDIYHDMKRLLTSSGRMSQS